MHNENTHIHHVMYTSEHSSLPSGQTTWYKVSVHRQNEVPTVVTPSNSVQLLDYPWNSEVNWVLFSAFIQAGYGPYQTTIQWTERHLSPNIKQAGCSTNHTTPHTAKA